MPFAKRSSRSPCPFGLPNESKPIPIRPIHPYFDGIGRTARLLTTLILHLGGYDLKGLYSLEAYYARNLGAYYQSLTVGPSHKYFMGRESTDLTGWLDYFCQGMTSSFESVRNQAEAAAGRGQPDHAEAIRLLDPRQRKALEFVPVEHHDHEPGGGIALRCLATHGSCAAVRLDQ